MSGYIVHTTRTYPSFCSIKSGLALAHMASILAIHKLEREQRIDKAGGGEARVFQN